MSPHTPRLAQLADEVSRNTTLLIDYLKLDDLPQPSFDPDGPLQPVPDSHVAASTARNRLIEATKELHTLAVGPRETTSFFCFNEVCLLAAMQVLCHFNVPQSVPQTGDISFQELASKTGLSETLLPRFLRMATSNYYFSEPRPGYIAHNPWSRLLATDEKMRACVWWRYSELMPTVAKFVDMIEKFPNSPEPQDTAFHLVFGDTFFDHKEKNPENMLKFGQFVSGFSVGNMADSADAIAEAYPWDSLPSGSLVVDIGGGIGHISAAIAKAHPHLRVQVQDFEDLKENSSGLLESCGVADRVSFAAHNFFEPQPTATRDAAVFFMRNILHDWSDLYCRRILKPVIEAMGPDSRLIISDIVLPEPNTVPKIQEARVRALDLTMLSLFNAKERSYADWVELLASVDGRLKITSVVGKPKMKRDSLIEVKLVSE